MNPLSCMVYDKYSHEACTIQGFFQDFGTDRAVSDMVEEVGLK